ncbi:hypothetical protein SAMN04488503_3218 [Humidesulfovibrio mexicanus]|uniref:Uncharacterized protein n=1 Tax=Humidesulfovibrio mexicanus TaxID=147047 RepID=A0A239CMN3_9BACT|nr:hypothetical protein [Humidesulfovibrio mexicanus]SNS21407.1 hypothetical protein SAMN04488503_3218 [Humidesulfovibrio mexicanus]
MTDADDGGHQNATRGNNAGSGSALDIARRIQRMALLVRRGAVQHPPSDTRTRPVRGDVPARPGHGWTNDAPRRQLGWWVLAQGRALDPENFASREAAREELLDAVRRAGALVTENVWVWDETARAQLVLATLPTRERAQRVAERLRAKGLRVVVRREMP